MGGHLSALPKGATACRSPRETFFTHRLTLDAKLQAALEGLAREAAAGLGPKLSCAILVIDNASGEIRAHVGAADYFSQERAGSIDMTGAIRSPGSAFNPFICALASANGIGTRKPFWTTGQDITELTRRKISTIPSRAP
jgi:penicillin-binding protein 1C